MFKPIQRLTAARILVLILAWLAIGVASSFAVAWTTMWIGPRNATTTNLAATPASGRSASRGVNSRAGLQTSVTVANTLRGSAVAWPYPCPDRWALPGKPRVSATLCREIRVFSSRGREIADGWDSSTQGTMQDVRAGLPFRCVYAWSTIDMAAGDDYSLRHNCSLRIPGTTARLPIGIIWRGLAYNTLVVAGAIGMAWGAREVGRRWRVRAGHCRRCRYDLRGLAAGAVCPECGTRLGGA